MELPTGSIIVAGPVIIENGNVLLNREHKPDGITPWYFPGGEVEDFDKSLEDACRREVKEELGIEIEIIKPLQPILKRQKEKNQMIILIHFLTKRIGDIQPGPETAEWGWHDIHNLPNNCAENVYEIIKSL